MLRLISGRFLPAPKDENVDTANKDGKPVVEIIASEKDDKSKAETTTEKSSDNGKEKLVSLVALQEERKKRQNMQVELDNANAKIKNSKDEKLKEDGKLAELLTERETEITELKDKLTKSDEITKNYNDLVDVEKADIKEALGEEWDDDFDAMPIGTLRKVSKKILGKTKANPNDDTGIVLDESTVTLTEDDKAHAKRMGLSEEGYARFKVKREKLKKEGDKQ